MFEGLWHPLVSKVAGIGSPAEVRSWDPRVLWCHAHPRCYPANTVRDSQLKLEKCQTLGYGQGGTAPMIPINPYLRGNVWKKWATFYLSVHLCTLWKPHFGAKYGPRGPPRAIYEPGGPGCYRDTYCIKRVKVRLGWEHLKWRICQKWSGNDEFWLKNEYRQISSSFSQHALNPFDTKPMAKIAVKMSIMRVVKFMSSWDNDFMSWPKHHQLLFGGQSVELPLSLHWFPWLPPGGCQRLSMWEVWGKNSQSFDVWRTLTPTGVKGCRNRVTCRSQVMRPQGPLMPCTPQMLSSKYCQR